MARYFYTNEASNILLFGILMLASKNRINDSLLFMQINTEVGVGLEGKVLFKSRKICSVPVGNNR